MTLSLSGQLDKSHSKPVIERTHTQVLGHEPDLTRMCRMAQIEGLRSIQQPFSGQFASLRYPRDT